MEKEYNISINITPKAFEGLARQGMLCHQGICELCDDALAATLPNEKARVCVALAPDADKNHLNIAVADWGCGMEDVEKARAPMFTTGGPERSGMGFTIMESFMSSLQVTSKPGKGTTVHMKRRIVQRRKTA